MGKISVKNIIFLISTKTYYCNDGENSKKVNILINIYKK